MGSLINHQYLRLDMYNAVDSRRMHVPHLGVRVTHIPTNIVVECHEYRSSHKNRENALQKLSELLLTSQC